MKPSVKTSADKNSISISIMLFKKIKMTSNIQSLKPVMRNRLKMTSILADFNAMEKMLHDFSEKILSVTKSVLLRR